VIDVASERATLAGVCIYGLDAYLDIADIVDVETYTVERNQSLFKVLGWIYRDGENIPIDVPTILSASKSIGLYEEIKENLDYVKAIFNFRVEKENIRSHAGTIARCQIIRGLDKKHDESKLNLAQLNGSASVDEIFAASESPLIEFMSGINREEESSLMGDGAGEYMEALGTDPRQMLGISTGYGIYDMQIGGGLQKGDVNVIAARPKVAKTSHADNSSTHIAGILEIPVLQLDTEMKKTRHQLRIVSNLSGVEMNEIKSGEYYKHKHKRDKVNQAVKKLEKMPFYYRNIAGMEFKEVISYIRRWLTKSVGINGDTGKLHDCVVILDYLKLCEASGLSKGIGEHQLIGFMLTDLMNLMLRYEVSNLTYVQQNRAGDDEDGTDTIANSDRILQFCGSLTLMQRKTPAEIAEDGPLNGNRKFKIIATRDGEQLTGNEWINYHLNGPTNRLKELGLRSKQNERQEQPDDEGGSIPF
jgi:replicative DNA helicase